MKRIRRPILLLFISFGLPFIALFILLTASASQIDIVGPEGSEQFGTTVIILPNGNIVVADPYYDAGAVADVGAVYLYDGSTGNLISKLTGSSAEDKIGYCGEDIIANYYCPSVIVLTNGNFVVLSTFWDNGAMQNVGAVTWGSGETGITGTVSPENSLIGSSFNDLLWPEIRTLNNGNYVVVSGYWDNGGEVEAGAVTWGDGTMGVTGIISSSNSLIGIHSQDRVGYAISELINGNFIVSSPGWDNGAEMDAGAVTWSDGTSGITGAVSPSNSLVGTSSEDEVGIIRELTNGNYLVLTPKWDNGIVTDTGAVTWGNGMTGITGEVSATNSLVGTSAFDSIGKICDNYYCETGLLTLTNGNYAILSPHWDNGTETDAGAVTWGAGTTGVTGAVSVTNSLVGSQTDDNIGVYCDSNYYCYSKSYILSNDNFVVISPEWDNGLITDAGAVTWVDGTTGIIGPVNSTNSLVGSTPNDSVGSNNFTQLTNSNYVVFSPNWDNGSVVDVGAATWSNGTTGITGTISPMNSLIGSSAGDQVGIGWALPLTNGNYVVRSPNWGNGTITNTGAVTWGDGTRGVTGTVGINNSLVGGSTDDQVGNWWTLVLTNGSYVISSPLWDNGSTVDAGAVTWGDGTTGVTGTVGVSNSLVGSSENDLVGRVETLALTNGNYIVRSHYWDNGAITDAGAVTWGDGTIGITGTVNANNSLVGSSTEDLWDSYSYSLANGNYIVSSPYWDNGAEMDAGAVTWGDGTMGVTGIISSSNSLIGIHSQDRVGYACNGYYCSRALVLANDNYVVSSPGWDNGVEMDAGAVTWGDGTMGVTGIISSSNSLIGIHSQDRVGYRISGLINGNFIVISPFWDNGAVTDAGAVTWGNGATGITGIVNSNNSLVGNTAYDLVGSHLGSHYLWTSSLSNDNNGNYVVFSPNWDNEDITDAGAVTLGDGYTGSTIGSLTMDNSVIGMAVGGGESLNFEFDNTYNQLVVGRPTENIVTLFSVNFPPLANAGPDQVVRINDFVQLDGSASIDLDGNLPLTYGWRQIEGPAVNLSNSTIVSPTFTAPAVDAEMVTLTLSLVVTNSLGIASVPDEVIITVEPIEIHLPAVLKPNN